jgi:hypothetical protein
VTTHFRRSAGRGAAWLARLTGGQEVGGSNPPGPTSKEPDHKSFFMFERLEQNLLAMRKVDAKLTRRPTEGEAARSDGDRAFFPARCSRRLDWGAPDSVSKSRLNYTHKVEGHIQ